MRRMAKPDVRIARKAVHALPGDLFLFAGVFDDLFNFRFFSRQLGMTQHAFCDGRETGVGANIGAGMAISAGQPQLYVSIVRKLDRLAGRGKDAITSQPSCYSYEKF